MAVALRYYDKASLDRLGWSEVLAFVIAACSFAPSREAIAAIVPAAGDPAAARRRLLVEELSLHVRTGADPHIGGAVDVREVVERASKGGVLDGGALFAVAETLRVVERVKGALTAAGPTLTDLGARLSFERSLRGELERAVEPDGALSDVASPLLGGLRAHQRSSFERLRERLETLAHAKAYSPYLQEPIVTMRNGRYVLPVRAESKSRVPGIVHDASATGQTVWIEPLEVVELGNAAREAEAAVVAEVARIFGILTDRVASAAAPLRSNLALLTELDAGLAILRTAATRDWNFAASATSGEIALKAARHPLLGETAVPMNLDLTADDRVLLITGPNTGGKTVALKTVGILTAMHHAGLPLPAEKGSALPQTGSVWADIGDDQSIAQSLSTFSGHLTAILRIHALAQPGDLVLLDEAGAGTDPAEGAALAAAIIDDFRARGMRLLATSHYAELKQYAHVTPGVQNGAVEFDLRTLRPTYRLTVGIPGGSQAFAIAQHLGLPESLLTAAQERRTDQGAALDASLAAAAVARQSAETAEVTATRLLQRAEEELRVAVQERRTALSTATDEARREAGDLLERVARLREALVGGSLTPELADRAEAVQRGLEDLAVQVAEPEAGGTKAAQERLEPSLGDLIVVRSGQQGRILAVNGDRVTLAFGSMHTEVHIGEVERVLQRATRESQLVRPVQREPIAATLDLRGARVEDALAALESRIDALLLAGGERLEIVHGVGTGALRDAVRKRLREMREVREVRDADAPGRDGVTIALL